MLLLAVASSARGQQTLSEEDVEELLNAHNYYRSLVDPIASNMLRLVRTDFKTGYHNIDLRELNFDFLLQAWDSTMANNADYWADNCQYEYNEDRHDQSTEYDYVGQNIVATDEQSVNYTILLGKWFKQRSKYNYYSGGCLDDDGEEQEELEGCEGYSQVKSTHIICIPTIKHIHVQNITSYSRTSIV